MDQHQQQLQNYIKQQLQLGQPADTVANQLASAGWQADHVREAFLAVQAQMVPTQMQPAFVPAPSAEQLQQRNENSLHQVTDGSSNGPLSTLPQATGNWRNRFKTGWTLLRQSSRILFGNKYLFRYFFMTWVAVIAINTVVVLIIIYGHSLFFNASTELAWFVLMFLNYIFIYFAINFYAAALSSNILDIFRGSRQPYSHYIKLARLKFWPIFVYSLIASIIGMILQLIFERVRLIGQLIVWFLGTIWSLGTMFVLPIIMNEEVSGTTAIKKSVGFFKQTWGENVIAKTTVGLPIFIIHIVLAMIFGGLLDAASGGGNLVLIYPIVIIYIILSMSLSVLGSFASNVVSVALYYYAINEQVPPGFSEEMLNNVFTARKRGRLGRKKALSTS